MEKVLVNKIGSRIVTVEFFNRKKWKQVFIIRRTIKEIKAIKN